MEFEELDPIIIAAIRHRGDHLPEKTSATWEELILWASPLRLLGRDFNIRGIGLLWDDPRQFTPDRRRYDVGIPIDAEDAEIVMPPAFVLVTMPGEYMKFRHMGPYDKIHETYREALGVSMQVEELELISAPIIEIYRNSPSEVDEDDLATDIYFPVIQL